jgi:hypothetical protein
VKQRPTSAGTLGAPLEEEDDLIDRLLEHNPKFHRYLKARLKERNISAKEAARRL